MQQLKLVPVVAALAAMLCLTAALPAAAAITKGPFLVNVWDRGVTVKWEDPADSRGQVEYGLTSQLGSVLPSVWAEGVHSVDLICLEPDSQYYYRVASGASTSAIYSFFTGVDSAAPFVFAAFGDNRTNYEDHRLVAARVAVEMPDFVLNTGDFVEVGLAASQWQDWFDAEQPLIAQTAFAGVMGNHEVWGGRPFFTKYFSHPNSIPEPSSYAFHYGNSQFIAIDTTRPFTVGSAQYQFIEQTLAAARDNPQCRHIFPFLHVSPYSSSNHGEDWDTLQARQILTPLFERYDVDIVFSGHDHNYEHGLVNNVHYVVTGGGGAPLYGNGHESWTVFSEKTYNLMRVEVDGDAVSVTALRPDGTLIEQFGFNHDAGGPGVPGMEWPDPCADDDDDDDSVDDDDDDDDAVDDDDDDDAADDDDDDAGCCG